MSVNPEEEPMTSSHQQLTNPRHRNGYTFHDVWVAASTQRNFDYAFWLKVTLGILADRGVLYGGNLLVCLATVLILGIGISGFFIVLPIVAKPWSTWMIFNIFWGIFLLVSVVFNYVCAVVTPPGYPNMDATTDESGSSSTEEQRQQCKKCNTPKPRRSHHCSICKRCVLKMDHHCPWINNCVGLNNYRYFFSFLFWVTISTGYVCALLAPYMINTGASLIIPGDKSSLSPSHPHKTMHRSSSSSSISISETKLRGPGRRDPLAVAHKQLDATISDVRPSESSSSSSSSIDGIIRTSSKRTTGTLERIPTTTISVGTTTNISTGTSVGNGSSWLSAFFGDWYAFYRLLTMPDAEPAQAPVLSWSTDTAAADNHSYLDISTSNSGSGSSSSRRHRREREEEQQQGQQGEKEMRWYSGSSSVGRKRGVAAAASISSSADTWLSNREHHDDQDKQITPSSRSRSTEETDDVIVNHRRLAMPSSHHHHQPYSTGVAAIAASAIVSPVFILEHWDKINQFFSAARAADEVIVIIFMVSMGIFAGVFLLFAFHFYLVASAQTTIEFSDSIEMRPKLKKAGRIYLNPYDRGFSMNFQQVFGYDTYWYIALLLPSLRKAPPAVPPPSPAMLKLPMHVTTATTATTATTSGAAVTSGNRWSEYPLPTPWGNTSNSGSGVWPMV